MVNPFRKKLNFEVLPGFCRFQISRDAAAWRFLSGVMVPASEAHAEAESAARQPRERS